MQTAQFLCPHCSSPLRIRDRAFLDRNIGCPECGEAISITLDDSRSPIVQKAISAKPAKKKRQRKKTKSPQENVESKESVETAIAAPRMNRQPLVQLGGRFAAVSSVLFTPLGIAWTVAGLVAVSMVFLVWPESSTPVADEPAKIAQQATSDNIEPRTVAKVPTETEEIPMPEFPVVSVAEQETLLKTRMLALGESLQDALDRRGHFPTGTVSIGDLPLERRFGWQADLLTTIEDASVAAPQWDQGWNDPLNDHFVRRQIPQLLNPLVSQQVDADRYPATHFVGVSGWGDDAALLPVDDPRAGIFGIDRVTREKHVTDGKANTMMVAGVQEKLGSWAAGSSSLRSFSQQPYINGPDGFGTGQKVGMMVLMADGSVRMLSKDTAAIIVERMACMADGLPLDASILGSPGEKKVIQEPDIPPPSPKTPEVPVVQKDPPIVEPMVPEQEDPAPPIEPEKPIDVAAALEVKILKFEQIQGAPLEDLLQQVAEMSGVPIQYDAALPPRTDEFWKRPTTIKLNDASVGEILKSLLENAELTYRAEKDHLLILPVKNSALKTSS